MVSFIESHLGKRYNFLAKTWNQVGQPRDKSWLFWLEAAWETEGALRWWLLRWQLPRLDYMTWELPIMDSPERSSRYRQNTGNVALGFCQLFKAERYLLKGLLSHGSNLWQTGLLSIQSSFFPLFLEPHFIQGNNLLCLKTILISLPWHLAWPCETKFD